HDVRVVAPARLIALAVLAQGFMLAPQAVMSRQLRSRDVTLIELFSNVIGSAVVSIPLAVLGWGYWSLAIGTVVQALTKAILLACIVRTPQAPLFDFVAIRALCARGSGHYFLMIVGRISAEIDRAVVGRYLGPADLGFYSRASAAASFPGSIYSVVVDRVTLPAFAKVQAQRERLVAAYRSGLSLVAMLGLPLTVCLIVLGPDLIRVLLGPGWEQAVLVFEFVSVSIYFRLAVLVSGTLLRSVGRPYLMTAIQLVVLIATGAAALVAWPHGIIAVAGAVVVVSLGEWLATTIAACREARFSLVAYLQTQGHGLAGSILCAVVLIAVLQLDGILGLKAPLRLALAGGSLALVGVAAIAAAPRFFLGATGQDALRLLLDGIRRGGRA
ncbi:MAG: polysaccharide biosynthesis protein, partial [Caulobacteraceae bacterium]|nr:polysaccharide biosynthesis protein [Caulobacteraceae bacterium]